MSAKSLKALTGRVAWISVGLISSGRFYSQEVFDRPLIGSDLRLPAGNALQRSTWLCGKKSRTARTGGFQPFAQRKRLLDNG